MKLQTSAKNKTLGSGLCGHDGDNAFPTQVRLGCGEQPFRTGRRGWSSYRPWLSGSQGTQQVSAEEWRGHLCEILSAVLEPHPSSEGWSKSKDGAVEAFLGIQQGIPPERAWSSQGPKEMGRAR